MTPTHRLQYRTADGRNFVNVKVELPGESSTVESTQEDMALATESSGSLNQDNFDGLSLGSAQDRIDQRSTAGSFAPEQDTQAHESEPPVVEGGAAIMETQVVETTDPVLQESKLLPSEVTMGTETTVELMLPDK